MVYVMVSVVGKVGNMNIKLSSITFLVAAVASIGFSQQAAHAGGANSRFAFAENTYILDQPTGRRGGSRYPGAHVEVAPIAAGIAPKMKGFDDGFVSKPAPPPPAPVVAAAPIARPSVSAQVKAPSLFNSLFNPVKTPAEMVANAPGKMDFGHPNALPAAPTPKMPTLAHSTNTAIKLMTPQHRHPVVAMHAPEAFKMPAVLHQGGGFAPTGNIPIEHSTGSSTSTNVQGVLMSKHH